MANNTLLNAGLGGDTLRDLDRSGVKTPVVALDLNPAGSEILMAGTLPVTQSGTWSVTTDSELTTADLDTGAGTDTRAVVGLVLAASGGGLLVGSTNPMPVSDNGGS